MLAYRDLSSSAENLFCFDVTELRGYIKKSTGGANRPRSGCEAEKIKLPPAHAGGGLREAGARLLDRDLLLLRAPGILRRHRSGQQAQAAARWAEELAPVIRAGVEIRGP